MQTTIDDNIGSIISDCNQTKKYLRFIKETLGKQKETHKILVQVS